MATRAGPGQGWLRNSGVVALFAGPAAVFLGAIVIYPAIATVSRSLYDRNGAHFVGLHNYRTLFGTTEILVAIRNNAIWVIVFPFLVSFIGLVFAVLTERISWATAFKTVVFMPMAISLFATGIIWRIVYETDPHLGVVNALERTVVDAVHPPGNYALPNIKPSTGLALRPDRSMVGLDTLQPGSTVLLGLTGITPSGVPPGARQVRSPTPAAGAITGVVWRDFFPGGQRGVIYPGEKGLPGMKLSLLRVGPGSTDRHVASASTDLSGAFRFATLKPGTYRVLLPASNFRAGFRGTNWLGAQSLTPTGHLGTTAAALVSVPLVTISAIIALLWMWCGFAMVVIGAGLAALNREVLEAAKVDGANEWQTFRLVTLPLLRPVLIVVFITMVINVLKIFDIILALAPDSSQQQANVIALEMWQVSFVAHDFGLGSAVAVFLFVLVIPVIFFNVKRIRG